MSIWSRNHTDLAQLAKSMQARNAQTRHGLDLRRLKGWQTDTLKQRAKSDSCIPLSVAHERSCTKLQIIDTDVDHSRDRVDSFSSADSAISPDFHRGPPSPILKCRTSNYGLSLNTPERCALDGIANASKFSDKKVKFVLETRTCPHKDSSEEGDVLMKQDSLGEAVHGLSLNGQEGSCNESFDVALGSCHNFTGEIISNGELPFTSGNVASTLPGIFHNTIHDTTQTSAIDNHFDEPAARIQPELDGKAHSIPATTGTSMATSVGCTSVSCSQKDANLQPSETCSCHADAVSDMSNVSVVSLTFECDDKTKTRSEPSLESCGEDRSVNCLQKAPIPTQLNISDELNLLLISVLANHKREQLSAGSTGQSVVSSQSLYHHHYPTSQTNASAKENLPKVQILDENAHFVNSEIADISNISVQACPHEPVANSNTIESCSTKPLRMSESHVKSLPYHTVVTPSNAHFVCSNFSFRLNPVITVASSTMAVSASVPDSSEEQITTLSSPRSKILTSQNAIFSMPSSVFPVFASVHSASAIVMSSSTTHLQAPVTSLAQPDHTALLLSMIDRDSEDVLVTRSLTKTTVSTFPTFATHTRMSCMHESRNPEVSDLVTKTIMNTHKTESNSDVLCSSVISHDSLMQSERNTHNHTVSPPLSCSINTHACSWHMDSESNVYQNLHSPCLSGPCSCSCTGYPVLEQALSSSNLPVSQPTPHEQRAAKCDFLSCKSDLTRVTVSPTELRSEEDTFSKESMIESNSYPTGKAVRKIPDSNRVTADSPELGINHGDETKMDDTDTQLSNWNSTSSDTANRVSVAPELHPGFVSTSHQNQHPSQLESDDFSSSRRIHSTTGFAGNSQTMKEKWHNPSNTSAFTGTTYYKESNQINTIPQSVVECSRCRGEISNCNRYIEQTISSQCIQCSGETVCANCNAYDADSSSLAVSPCSSGGADNVDKPFSANQTFMNQNGYSGKGRRVSHHDHANGHSNNTTYTKGVVGTFSTGNHALNSFSPQTNGVSRNGFGTQSRRKFRSRSSTSSHDSLSDSVYSEAGSHAILGILNIDRSLNGKKRGHKKERLRLNGDQLELILQKLETSSNIFLSQPPSELKGIKEDLHLLSRALRRQQKRSKATLIKDIADRVCLFERSGNVHSASAQSGQDKLTYGAERGPRNYGTDSKTEMPSRKRKYSVQRVLTQKPDTEEASLQCFKTNMSVPQQISDLSSIRHHGDLETLEKQFELAIENDPAQLESAVESLSELKKWMTQHRLLAQDPGSVTFEQKQNSSEIPLVISEDKISGSPTITPNSLHNLSCVDSGCHKDDFAFESHKTRECMTVNVNGSYTGTVSENSENILSQQQLCQQGSDVSREGLSHRIGHMPTNSEGHWSLWQHQQWSGSGAEVRPSSQHQAPAESGTMESEGDLQFQMDREFDKHLADMKPYVLKLPHKTDRQKCAVWIKKLCEPPGAGTAARKNRNMYAQLMLHMLKKGSLHSPFDQKPEDGPLQPLPSYMSIYFDDPLGDVLKKAERLPDWVEGELGDTAGSSMLPKSLGNPAATSTWVSSIGEFRDRPHSSMGHTLDKDPSLSPIRNSEFARSRGYSADDMSLELKRSPSPPAAQRRIKSQHSPSADRERRQLPDVRLRDTREQVRTKDLTNNDTDWSKPFTSSVTSTYSLPKGNTYYDESSYHKPTDREVAVRTKMIEAKFHEEKLKLQQKHDTAVQKILDRKNAEIEDVKNHYKAKSKEMEEVTSKLERKVQTLMKETEFIRQTKEKQIAELKKIAEESQETRKNEFEKRLHGVMTEFEQEKFELQKQHTQNIQEILDDTNNRLQRMEAEYSQQTTATTNVIKELESRVQQLMSEVDSTLSQRSAVEKEKNDSLAKYEKLFNEHERLKEKLCQQERDHQVAIEGHEHELRSLKNKTEASLEYLRQEHTMAASKAADTISELEEKVEYLKKSLKDTEEHRHRQIRELEQGHQQDKVHLENLHDKQIRNMKKEIEQLDSDWVKKVAKLEQQIKDREQEVTKLKEQKQQQSVQSEQALEEFKLQVEKNQNRIYDEMKQQMQQVETDLQKSKQAREKQGKDEKYKHQHEVAELKMAFEAEKSQLMRDMHVQKEYILTEHDKDLENLKELQRAEVQALEARLRERQDKFEKSATDNERLIRELREELVQANQLRKQQLVELGLLREEEKQKMQRDHEAELARMRTEMEQQRLEQQRAHSAEMEAVLEKTNERLKGIEKDYADRGTKSTESIAELQAVVAQLRGDIKRSRESSDEKLAELKHQYEEEKQNLRKQYSQNLATIQRELENQRTKVRNAERQIEKAESDHEERMTSLKLQFEGKIRGLLPASLKQELEDTIASLKSQVSSLQQRSVLLQEELDNRNKNPLGPFASRTSSPIKSAI